MTSGHDRRIFGWALYDAGRSAFATVTIGAILPAYFQSTVVPPEGVVVFGDPWSAESLWGLMSGVGPLLLLVLLPVLGAVADRSGAKLGLLKVFAYSGAFVAATLMFAGEGDVWFTLAVFLAALMLFAGGNVVYDGLLTDLTSPSTVHQVSARGVAYGFVGGGAHLVLALAALTLFPEPLTTRLVIGSVGVWWAAVAAVSFRYLGRQGAPSGSRVVGRSVGVELRAAVAKTWATARRVRRFRHLSLFLIAYLFYSDGVQTVVVLTSVYSAETLGHSASTIIGAFLLVQVMSAASTRVAGYLAVHVGARPTLTGILAIWVALVVAAYYLPAGAPGPYFLLAATMGLVLGGVSTLSRSIFATMIPPEASAEFFGFFTLLSRFAAIWGPLVFTAVRQATGSGRSAILTIAGFLVVGLVVLQFVDLDEAQRSRQRWSGNEEPGAEPARR